MSGLKWWNNQPIGVTIPKATLLKVYNPNTTEIPKRDS